MSDATNALTALARVLAPLVAAELATVDPPLAYSSAGPLPPGWSRRRFLERVRTMPGAVRTGGLRGRGVVWTISSAAWSATTTTTPEPSNVVSIDSILASSGYRPTRAAR